MYYRIIKIITIPQRITAYIIALYPFNQFWANTWFFLKTVVIKKVGKHFFSTTADKSYSAYGNGVNKFIGV